MQAKALKTRSRLSQDYSTIQPKLEIEEPGKKEETRPASSKAKSGNVPNNGNQSDT
jgi:hypothetical protein